MKNASSHVIDFYQKSYFLPTGNGPVEQMAVDSINVLNPEGVYFLPSKETNRLKAKYCSTDKSDLNSQFKRDLSRSFFQIGKSDKEFLYKIYYSECKATKSRILNNSYNAFQLNIPFNEKIEFLTCYFIYQDIILAEIEKIDSRNFLRVQN